MSFLLLSVCCWFFCYCFNIYLVVVHNKPHLVLNNNKMHVLQCIICWLLPAITLTAYFISEHDGNYFGIVATDNLSCTPANSGLVLYLFMFPSQLAVSAGTTLLVSTLLFLRKVNCSSCIGNILCSNHLFCVGTE